MRAAFIEIPLYLEAKSPFNKGADLIIATEHEGEPNKIGLNLANFLSLNNNEWSYKNIGKLAANLVVHLKKNNTEIQVGGYGLSLDKYSSDGFFSYRVDFNINTMTSCDKKFYCFKDGVSEVFILRAAFQKFCNEDKFYEDVLFKNYATLYDDWLKRKMNK